MYFVYYVFDDVLVDYIIFSYLTLYYLQDVMLIVCSL